MSKKDKYLVNENIKADKLLLIDDNANKIGLKTKLDALALAKERGMDLVVVAPNADPPVCKIMDYGRYIFKKEKQQQKARKGQHTTRVRELRVKPTIEDSDLKVKFKKMKEFLEEKDKVRINLFFKGREKIHMERYKDRVFGRLIELAEEIADVEESPMFENSKYTILFSPKKK
ncbi:translation initiation factor IF-3 [Planctomycetota bacterium]